jgi:two-component system CheB/CheR fusion protein
MYFTPETQARILERFNFALNRTGFLFLGKSEMLITHGDLFTPHSLKWRVFRKVERNNFRERLAFVAGEGAEAPAERYAGVLAAAARLSPIAQIAVDRAGFLADANVRARELFSLGGADIGRPLQDLAVSYRPAELRSAIDRAYEENAPVRIGRIEFVRPGGDERILEIDVTPVPGASGEPLGVTVMFNDVTTLARLHDDYDRSRRELETAYEELQSTVEELETTNEELQSTNEELETTNEELQSTNEELETTNEELQSTNEELETMNEELQSTNDELETMNQEVNSRATELDRVHTFLEGILGSLGVGVAVVDRERTVQVWNAKSADLWGLRADEVEGNDFLKLDIGLPVGKLKDMLQSTLDGSSETSEQMVEAVNRRGRKFDCLVRVLPLHTRTGEAYGAVVLTAPLTDGRSSLPDVADSGS